MFKIIILLLCMTLALPGSSQSTSFDCQYVSARWGSLGTIYRCDVQNSVRITSTDTAQIDAVTGTHLAGYNNDNVEGIQVHSKGQIHFFPRGLNKIFKNLKAIFIYTTGLKEVHQSDLKDFPNLKHLSLTKNSLEILEKDLFEFNPNLENIYLNSNKISHIDPNVFDKLTNLKTLYLSSNACIDMTAENNPTSVQNIIKTAKNQCTNSDYSNLEQSVKNFEAESSALSSEQFKEKLEKLENEVKNSKFPIFFRDKLLGIRADQVKKAQQEAKTPTTTTEPTTTTAKRSKLETCSALESKVDKMTENLTDLMILATNGTDTQKCAALINENFTKMSQNIAKIDEKLSGTAAQVNNSQFDALKDDLRTQIGDINTKMSQNIAKIDEKLTKTAAQMNNSQFDALKDDLRTQIGDINTKMSQIIAKIDEKLTKTAAQMNNSQFDALKDDLRNRNEDIDTKLEILDENVQNTKTAMLREIQNIKNAATIDHAGLLSSLRFRTDKIEKAMKEMKEQNQKIMKALNINE
ncbi:adhesin Ata autotransporter-like [Chironomus tepperi]|uniref:adhesin Ata autotransporter-like n=1 Tax=Chironomus tepperi TaxID=113505 RepID=UPI00391F03D3